MNRKEFKNRRRSGIEMQQVNESINDREIMGMHSSVTVYFSCFKKK
jgi:hypothetical protein